MANEQIRAQVRQALGQQWEAFAAKHPHLAAAMDQETATEMCMSDLRGDPEFQQALNAVKETQLFAFAVEDTIARLVKVWIGM